MLNGLLPIGSVVKLYDGEAMLMITGYFGISQEQPDYVWDYVGVVFPGGSKDSNSNYLFDRAQIEQYTFIGFEDDEEQEFVQALIESEEQIKASAKGGN